MGDNDVLGFAGWDNYYCNRCKCTHYKEECPLAKRDEVRKDG